MEHLKKTSGDAYLITGLNRGGENEKSSRYFSMQFGRLKRELGISDDTVCPMD